MHSRTDFAHFQGNLKWTIRIPVLGSPYRALISGTPITIIMEITYEFLGFTSTPQKLIFHIIWQMGGSRCMQNTPTRCGNDLPKLFRNHLSAKQVCVDAPFIDDHMCSPIYHFLVCFKQNATSKMTVPTVGSFHCFHEKVTLT